MEAGSRRCLTENQDLLQSTRSQFQLVVKGKACWKSLTMSKD